MNVIRENGIAVAQRKFLLAFDFTLLTCATWKSVVEVVLFQTNAISCNCVEHSELFSHVTTVPSSDGIMYLFCKSSYLPPLR